MDTNFYIPRTLVSYDKTHSEADLLANHQFVIILAEPGAGKTALMHSLASQLGTNETTASVFSHTHISTTNVPLIIDAFDELSRLDASGIHKLLGKAQAFQPTHVYVSSRSSEWDDAATATFKSFFECAPLIVRLEEFDEEEQQKIFERHLPGEDFVSFKNEVSRFDLETLLPNPQFLKLFADAYIESGRHFSDKRSMFVKATERLAKEANKELTTKSKLSILRKIELASEVFAKLLLSGAEGVTTNEATEERAYPLLTSIASDASVEDILATRLFKLGENIDQHRPVHRIVAEYCAANYLVRRIAEPNDALTLPKCLAVIAPKSTVRDELRGLLGWMAALGDTSVQKAAIELDPYAVLANGDPSQLLDSSKCLLIKQLKRTEAIDPYFRRGDFMRRFSVAGFFAPQVLDEVKHLLTSESDGHLCGLLLELLEGATGIDPVIGELRNLLLSQNGSEHTRILASRCLIGIPNYQAPPDLSVLISEASQTSLSIAAEIFLSLQIEKLDITYLSTFFHACATLYPTQQELLTRPYRSLYFVKVLIRHLPLRIIEQLLNEFTEHLACTCGKKSYECDCRTGISKIVGSLLDGYFDLASSPFNIEQLWCWLKNLNFHSHKGADQSSAVKVLQENDSLRQEIIDYAFRELNDRDAIFHMRRNHFDGHCHAGLIFQQSDNKFIVDLAFNIENVDLWTSFIPAHRFYRDKKDRKPEPLRSHMRKQALAKPLLMRKWAHSNRLTAKQMKDEYLKWHYPYYRRARRFERQTAEQKAKNLKFFQENREIIESGQHFRCLLHFSELMLYEPARIRDEVGDEQLVQNALLNCLDFITPDIPDLKRLAELQCASQRLYVENVLYAACIVTMRVKGSLQEVSIPLLTALRTNIYGGGNGTTKEERTALKTEVDRLLFSDVVNSEEFIRQYIEPQLESQCASPGVSMLRSEEPFNHLRGKLSIEWLIRFPNLSFYALDTLFEIAAQFSNLDDLKKIIAERCAKFMSNDETSEQREDFKQKQIFWLVRAWIFLDDIPDFYWEKFISDKGNLLVLRECTGRYGPTRHPYWPVLSPKKIEAVLYAFFDAWPKVDLPTHWGSESPEGENAYRFFTEVIWLIASSDSEESIEVLERLLADTRFEDLHNELKSMYTGHVRKQALRDFEPPLPIEIVNLLDKDEVVTVEGLRQLVLQELQELQNAINGGEFNTVNLFYDKDTRKNEERCRDIIAERFSIRLAPQDITITLEHQLKDLKRSDFTATKMIGGKRRLLVTEVKGQWHKELYTAAAAQLYERYAIHQDAEKQGIFLAIWFGANELVAGLKTHNIKTAQELKSIIESTLPPELIGLIDVFVLDVSKKA